MHEPLDRVDHRPWPLPAAAWGWRQSWLDIAFVHYRVDAAALQARERLLDVEALTVRSDGTYPPICGHSGFWVRPEFDSAVAVLEAKMTPAGTEMDTSAAAPPSEQVL